MDNTQIPVVKFEGTEGTPEYFKVAEAQGVRVGVRLLTKRSHGFGAHCFALDIRCRVSSPENNIDIEKVVFPNMIFAPFSKVRSTHGSIVRHLGTILIRNKAEYQQAVTWLNTSSFVKDEVLSCMNMRFNTDVIKAEFELVPNLNAVISAIKEEVLTGLQEIEQLLEMADENVVSFEAKK